MKQFDWQWIPVAAIVGFFVVLFGWALVRSRGVRAVQVEEPTPVAVSATAAPLYEPIPPEIDAVDNYPRARSVERKMEELLNGDVVTVRQHSQNRYHLIVNVVVSDEDNADNVDWELFNTYLQELHSGADSFWEVWVLVFQSKPATSTGYEPVRILTHSATVKCKFLPELACLPVMGEGFLLQAEYAFLANRAE